LYNRTSSCTLCAVASPDSGGKAGMNTDEPNPALILPDATAD
jgi:hypothetical protein